MILSGNITRKEFVRVVIGRTFSHVRGHRDLYCPFTGEPVNRTFWERTRPGDMNACPKCHSDQRTSAEKLHDANEKRSAYGKNN